MTNDRGQGARDSLKQGIKAAKNGNKAKARDLLYAALDEEPRNETVWVWLSYVVETVEDRQICLENALTINPANQYALRGLSQINDIRSKQKSLPVAADKDKSRRPAAQAEHRAAPRSLPLMLATAFWFGLGLTFLALGVGDVFEWFFKVTQNPPFPEYITPYQLWLLIISVSFLIVGILLLNIAWGLYARRKFGYYASIIFALGFTLVAPTVISISKRPNYLLAIFAAVMPTLVLFLTLLGQMGFDYGQKQASHPE